MAAGEVAAIPCADACTLVLLPGPSLQVMEPRPDTSLTHALAYWPNLVHDRPELGVMVFALIAELFDERIDKPLAALVGDLFLARADGSPQRFYSLSAQIQRERKNYYDALERTQRDTLDVTNWLSSFLGTLTSSKWATIARCTPDTALRDITQLRELGVLKNAPGGGRSTGYEPAD